MRATRPRLCWSVLIGLGLLVAGPCWAEDNLIRFGAGFYSVAGDFTDPPVLLDDGPGFFVDYERSITKKLGLDIGFEAALFELGLFGNDDVDMRLLTARADYYLTKGDDVRFFIYPMIGYLDLDSEDDSDSSLAWGAGAGIDVAIGESKWVFSGGLSYLTADVTDMTFGAFAVKAGLGRRF